MGLNRAYLLCGPFKEHTWHSIRPRLALQVIWSRLPPPYSSTIQRQYCPVNLRGIGEKANSGAAFRMTKGVSDLNQK